jgi:hypothetical protein
MGLSCGKGSRIPFLDRALHTFKEKREERLMAEKDLTPEDVIAGGPDTDDPIDVAYARTGHAATSGISGNPAEDEDAGAERKKLYKDGAEIVSRID